MSVKKKIWISIAIILVILLIDQFIKIEVKTNMFLGDRIKITDWFYILFTENRGMAFGIEIFKGTGFENTGKIFLTLFRIFAIGFLAYYLFYEIKHKAPMGYIVCLAMIVAGAAGNIIDSMFYGLIFNASGYTPLHIAHFVPFGTGYDSFLMGRVVDMFYFPLFEWTMPNIPLISSLPFLPEPGETQVFFGAIFNFADSAISVGIVALILFYRKQFSKRLSELGSDNKK